MTAHEAYELIEGGPKAPVLLTCEHASERLPGGWQWPRSDARLRGTHWAYDLGAREIVHELAAALGAPAVLSRFTRLLVDPNREDDHVDLFRERADGEPVALNSALTDDDRVRRVEQYYRPYHDAVDQALSSHAAPVLLSVHTFTPLYEGHVRHVQLGVLFNDDEVLAQELLEHLHHRLPEVRPNEPWSGKQGLIYAAERHARAHGRCALELEVRQDLASDHAYRARLTEAVVAFFSTR